MTRPILILVNANYVITVPTCQSVVFATTWTMYQSVSFVHSITVRTCNSIVFATTMSRLRHQRSHISVCCVCYAIANIQDCKLSLSAYDVLSLPHQCIRLKA